IWWLVGEKSRFLARPRSLRWLRTARNDQSRGLSAIRDVEATSLQFVARDEPAAARDVASYVSTEIALQNFTRVDRLFTVFPREEVFLSSAEAGNCKEAGPRRTS